MTRIAIMQPYLFPYIGYWQLMESADVFVLLDNVNFINKGYINRNYLLLNNKKERFTLELQKSSQNKLIKDIYTGHNASKIIKTFYHAYKKSLNFDEVYQLVKYSLENTEGFNLSDLLFKSINIIKNYLFIECDILRASDLKLTNFKNAQERIIQICKYFDADEYVNNISGFSLYEKNIFKDNGLNLIFLEAQISEYKQFSKEFIPGLSIIDVAMFNKKTKIKKMLGEFKI